MKSIGLSKINLEEAEQLTKQKIYLIFSIIYIIHIYKFST